MIRPKRFSLLDQGEKICIRPEINHYENLKIIRDFYGTIIPSMNDLPDRQNSTPDITECNFQ